MDETQKPAAGANDERAMNETRTSVRVDDSIYNIAIGYLRAGISIIPLRVDGSKAPAIPWKEYQQRYATEDEVREWFSQRYAIGIVCGEISGGLEVLDFDHETTYNYFIIRAPDFATELPIVQTPGNGYHVIYRCDEIGHNTKIATDPRKRKPTLIETRGEGGYIVGVGSPLGVHERKNLSYHQIMGPNLPAIPHITPEERRRIWQLARTFDRSPKPKRTQPARSYPKCDSIEQYNRNPDWAAVLPGWTTSDGIHWTRPGKKQGCSAKICTAKDGTPILTIFSTNAGVKPQSYNAFELLVRNCFRGDRRAALQAIKKGQR